MHILLSLILLALPMITQAESGPPVSSWEKIKSKTTRQKIVKRAAGLDSRKFDGKFPLKLTYDKVCMNLQSEDAPTKIESDCNKFLTSKIVAILTYPEYMEALKELGVTTISIHLVKSGKPVNVGVTKESVCQGGAGRGKKFKIESVLSLSSFVGINGQCIDVSKEILAELEALVEKSPKSQIVRSLKDKPGYKVAINGDRYKKEVHVKKAKSKVDFRRVVQE